MATPWYLRYFIPDWWAVARYEYDAERTDREVAYLAEVLQAFAPGPRVLDLGCGVGRHAVALARRGFEVTAMDVSAWALARAREAAEAAGVEVTWHQVDLLTARSWPVGPVDAMVCVQSFGWGSDAEQLRFLRTSHDHLRPGGLLILDHSNATAILRAYVPEARFEAPDLCAEFRRSYDALGGRSAGLLRVSYPDGRTVELRDDVRLYQPPEVRSLLEASGFDVQRADADFVPGSQVRPDTRYVEFVARRSSHPVDLPAISSYRAHRPDALDLRWSPDEVEPIRPALEQAWRTAATGDLGTLVDLARRYAVTDPFGGARAAPILSEHFGTRIDADTVTFGAGTTGLLHALAALGVPGPVLHARACHPELPRWARQLGAQLIAEDLVGTPEAAAAVVRSRRPGLVVLDRPDPRGEFPDLSTVRLLAEAASEVGAVVAVDEACATYAGPASSAVRLTAEFDNLAVLRSLSKGYCCGGLRVGFAVTSAALGGLVRAVAPPLGTSELAFVVALELLRLGDVLEPLRRRIAEAKPWTVLALRLAGLDVHPGAPCFPWVVVTDDEPARTTLRRRRVMAKRLDLLDADGSPTTLLKLAIPLSTGRAAAFRRAFPEGGAEPARTGASR